MILLYDAIGKIELVQTGVCVNRATAAADGYLVCDPGGQRTLAAGLLAFNLDELIQPELAELTVSAVYAKSDRYRVQTVNGVVSLVEITPPTRGKRALTPTVVAVATASKGDVRAAAAGDAQLVALAALSDEELAKFVGSQSAADAGTQGLLVLCARVLKLLAAYTGLAN